MSYKWYCSFPAPLSVPLLPPLPMIPTIFLTLTLSPHTAILQQTTFRKKVGKLWKHCGKGAISSSVTMFSNVVCCSRHKKEYLWSKGLTIHGICQLLVLPWPLVFISIWLTLCHVLCLSSGNFGMDFSARTFVRFV